MPYHLPISIKFSIMPWWTVSSLAIRTRSSAYFTVWIICPPILKPPSPSRPSLVRHSLYKLNKIGDKQHPCLVPLPICTLFVSPRSSRTLTLWCMYNLLVNLLSLQFVPVLFRNCINLVQFTRSNSFYQSVKQILSRTSMFTVRRSTLGGNKLVPSRTFCPRVVARGLAEEEILKVRGALTLRVFFGIFWWWVDTLCLQLSRRRRGIWGGGRPAERGLRVLLHSRGLSGRREMWVKELFGSCLWFKILFGFGGCGDVLNAH
jgi:hypothetical protein